MHNQKKLSEGEQKYIKTTGDLNCQAWDSPQLLQFKKQRQSGSSWNYTHHGVLSAILAALASLR